MQKRGVKRGIDAESWDDRQGSGSKRTRFADQVDDVDNAEDLALPASSKAVRLDGYDSDTDSEDERAEQNAANDEDDMFSSAPKPSADASKPQVDDSDSIRDSGLKVKSGAAQTGAKGKDKQFLDIHDIEGQEFESTKEAVPEGVKMQVEEGSDVEGSDEDFVSGDEMANADDAPRSRRTKKGMGYVLSSFNMKEEMEEGDFNAEGTFVAKEKDPYAIHDAWLNDVGTKHDIRAARRAKEAREALAAQQDAADKTKSRVECLKELVETGLLQKKNGETVMGALKRLGDEKRKIKSQTAKKAKSKQAASAQTGSERVKELTAQIDQLTALASLLLDAYGETDIYDETYDGVVKTLRLEGEVPRGWEPEIALREANDAEQDGVEEEAQSTNVRRGLINREPQPESVPPSDAATYFYKWTDAAVNVPPEQRGQPLGPFSSQEMQAWISQGYFGPQASNILVRKPEDIEWRTWA